MSELLDGIKQEEANVSMLEDLRNKPEEAGGEYTQSEQWRPDPGEGIEGILVDTFSFQGKYKDFSTGEFPTIPGWVLRVDGDETPWSVAGLHGVLRQEMAKAEEKGLKPGDRVAVLYTGKRPTRDGSGEYHHYRLAFRPGNGSVPEPRAEANGAKPAGKPTQSRSQSTQHESTPRRKPGSAKPTSDEPDF